MTYIYEWFGWPDIVDVICPQCGKKTAFAGSKQVVKKQYNQGQPVTRLFTDKRTGYVSCLSCGLTKVKTIQWPQDAYYKINVRGNVLWAWNEEHAKDIRDYLNSTSRVRRNFTYVASLYHIPEIFKLAKNRKKCVLGLNKIIGSSNA